ncbi:hypothetical protein BX600DRAFT_436717 [Xylariales sp. PMI_506]|nr:hypothetical protein BX600DRAFT_436717 [Xylariales sp. PMI_506]
MKRSRSIALSWTLGPLFGSPAYGQDAPSVANFLRRGMATAVVIGDYLYIDGGEVSQLFNGTVDGDHPSWVVNSTLSIPLASSWTNETVGLRSIEKSAPGQDEQVLWFDEARSTFYIWSGLTPVFGPVVSNQLWSFAADGSGGGNWTQVEPSTLPAFTSSLRTIDSAYATLNGVGYSLGGYVGPQEDTGITQNVAIQGIINFNMTSLAWTNTSSVGYGANGTSQGAQMEAVPFGPNGLLAVLGGAMSPQGIYNTETETEFNNLWLLDPITRKWYSQPTTGSMPTPRQSFCTVGVPGPNGTYEIFIYGGISSDVYATLDDIYVLSLPGFVLFQSPVSGTPRQNQACVNIPRRNSNQMLVVGGTDGILGYPKSYVDPDPWSQGLGIFNMTAMSWAAGYDPDAPDYDSPQIVKDWYDQGGLDAVVWASDEIKGLFIEGTNTSAVNGTGSSSSSSPASSGDESSPSDTDASGSASHAGAIAGGVVGGVAALAIIVMLERWLRRRHRRKQHAAQGSAGAGTHQLYPGFAMMGQKQELSEGGAMYSPDHPWHYYGATPGVVSGRLYEMEAVPPGPKELDPDNFVRSELPDNGLSRTATVSPAHTFTSSAGTYRTTTTTTTTDEGCYSQPVATAGGHLYQGVPQGWYQRKQ